MQLCCVKLPLAVKFDFVELNVARCATLLLNYIKLFLNFSSKRKI